MDLRSKTIAVANAVRMDRYPAARAIFAAGSFIRGDATAYSDLDLVVVFETLPNAYRESFRFEDMPVEAFVHDPETLNYFFFEVDRPSGISALMQMVVEGVEIPEPSTLSLKLKKLAASFIDMGPPELTAEQRRKLRYQITNYADDIRAPRSYDELVAAASQLYDALANYYFRRDGLWSAAGKSIPRALARREPEFSVRFRQSFEMLFRQGDPAAVIALAEEILLPDGGLLFDGHRADAPPAWRKALADGQV